MSESAIAQHGEVMKTTMRALIGLLMCGFVAVKLMTCGVPLAKSPPASAAAPQVIHRDLYGPRSIRFAEPDSPFPLRDAGDTSEFPAAGPSFTHTRRATD